MGDNVYVAALLLAIFLLGAACFVWTDFMSAFMGGIWLRVLPKNIRRPLTRIVGAGTMLFALLLLYYGVLKEMFR
jgi:hypothetical protein